jgi:hypothetical protein
VLLVIYSSEKGVQLGRPQAIAQIMPETRTLTQEPPWSGRASLNCHNGAAR